MPQLLTPKKKQKILACIFIYNTEKHRTSTTKLKYTFLAILPSFPNDRKKQVTPASFRFFQKLCTAILVRILHEQTYNQHDRVQQLDSWIAVRIALFKTQNDVTCFVSLTFQIFLTPYMFFQATCFYMELLEFGLLI